MHCSAARNLLDNKLYAIKRIADTFEYLIYAKRTLRELRILRHLQHDNVVDLVDVMLPKKARNLSEV